MSPKTTLLVSIIALLVSLSTLFVVIAMQNRLAHLEANALITDGNPNPADTTRGVTDGNPNPASSAR